MHPWVCCARYKTGGPAKGAGRAVEGCRLTAPHIQLTAGQGSTGPGWPDLLVFPEKVEVHTVDNFQLLRGGNTFRKFKSSTQAQENVGVGHQFHSLE